MLVSTCVYVHTSRMYTIHNPMQVCVYAYPAGMHLRGMCHFALAARAVGLRACISGVSTTLTFELEVARICTLKDAREKKQQTKTTMRMLVDMSTAICLQAQCT
jgi:hypothetical protein